MNEISFILNQLIFFVADFSLLSCESDNFALLIPNKFEEQVCNTFTAPFEKSAIVYLTFLILKNMVVFPAGSRFPINLICCVAAEYVFICSYAMFYSLEKDVPTINHE